MLCQDCIKKGGCKELCPDAEDFVNQDHVYLKELPVEIERIEYAKIEWPGKIKIVYITETEKKILTLIKKSFSYQEISYLLNITYTSLTTHISNIRKKFNNNQKS